MTDEQLERMVREWLNGPRCMDVEGEERHLAELLRTVRDQQREEDDDRYAKLLDAADVGIGLLQYLAGWFKAEASSGRTRARRCREVADAIREARDDYRIES